MSSIKTDMSWISQETHCVVKVFTTNQLFTLKRKGISCGPKWDKRFRFLLTRRFLNTHFEHVTHKSFLHQKGQTLSCFIFQSSSELREQKCHALYGKRLLKSHVQLRMMRNVVRIKQEKLASFTLSEISHILAFLDADNFCWELFVSPSSHPWGSKTPGLGLRNSPPHGSSAGEGTSGGSGNKPSARDPLTVGSWILGSRWVLFVLRVFIVIDGGFGDGLEMHCEEVPVLLIGREGRPCFARYHMVYANNMMHWHMMQRRRPCPGQRICVEF